MSRAVPDVEAMTHEEYLWARVVAALEAAFGAPRRGVAAADLVRAYEARGSRRA